MSILRPSKLGIISCPGAEQFSGKVLHHLRKLYTKQYQYLVNKISDRYETDPQTIAKYTAMLDEINGDVRNTGGCCPGEYNAPNFQVPTQFTRFANGEFKSEVLQSVRGMRIFIIQDVTNSYPLNFHDSSESVSLTVNDHILILLSVVNALRVSGVESIHLVLPTYPYSRQHKKKGREALMASLFGQLMEQSGVSRIITLDIHSKEIENSFSRLSLENMHASYQILLNLRKVVPLDDPDLVIVSPDTGAVDRNKFFSNTLSRPLALLYKERDYSKVSKVGESNITKMTLLGEVKDKVVFMCDDMLGTGGTVIKAMENLKQMGARKIIIAVSLPFFNGNAIEKFDEAYKRGVFDRIIGTNAVYHDESLLSKEWYIQSDVTDLFARIISRLHHGRPLSPLLNSNKIIKKLLREEHHKKDSNS